LVPVHKRPGLKAGAFSRALLVPVAATEINGLYKPGLKAFFPPVPVTWVPLQTTYTDGLNYHQHEIALYIKIHKLKISHFIFNS
jgi:hypothetical protein